MSGQKKPPAQSNSLFSYFSKNVGSSSSGSIPVPGPSSSKPVFPASKSPAAPSAAAQHSSIAQQAGITNTPIMPKAFTTPLKPVSSLPSFSPSLNSSAPRPAAPSPASTSAAKASAQVNNNQRKVKRIIESDADEDDEDESKCADFRESESPVGCSKKRKSISRDDEEYVDDQHADSEDDDEEEDDYQDDDESEDERPKKRSNPSAKKRATPSKPVKKAPCVLSSDRELFVGDESSEAKQHVNITGKEYDRPFLTNPCDKNGIKKGQPGYDPTTLKIEEKHMKSMTPAEQQYWKIKMNYFDVVLFFKMGKFYELFDDDAVIGVSELGLNYMVNQARPHVGFPEAALNKYGHELISRGYQVGVVEQTQTPKQLQASNAAAKLKDSKAKTSKAVDRQLVSVETKATLIEPATPNAVYVFSVCERELTEHERQQLTHEATTSQFSGGELVAEYGVCYIDCSTSKVVCGQFYDDDRRSHFRTLIGWLSPAEVIHPRDSLSASTNFMFKTDLGKDVRYVELEPGTQFWCMSTTKRELLQAKYFEPQDSTQPPTQINYPHFPNALIQLFENHQEAALSAFGGLVNYLRRMKQDVGHLAFKNIHIYEERLMGEQAQYMTLDGQTLLNLEIVKNSEGGSEGTLLKFLDHCQSAYGKRLLHDWVCAPLASINLIEQRQDAVKWLMEHDDIRKSFQSRIQKLPDLDRKLARVHANGRKTKHSVVMYGNQEQKKLELFLDVLNGFHTVLKIMREFQQHNDLSSSSYLSRLVSVAGDFPDYEPLLNKFYHSFDHNTAKTHGFIVPNRGNSQIYDKICDEEKAIKDDLNLYLKEVRAKFNDNNIRYVDKTTEVYQLEIPLKLLKKDAPYGWTQQSSTKSVRRFYTPEIIENVQQLQDVEEKKDEFLKDTSRKAFADFAAESETWMHVVRVLAELDCLCSLAIVSSQNMSTSSMCKPEFVPCNDNKDNTMLELKQCIHPVLASLATKSQFIPNDASIGCGDNPSKFVLVSGPNMGGKSTLLRQLCVAVIMAQLGCHVAASECRLTPVDRIFTRVGANDKIMQGQSTFMVEMMETASILKHVSKRSLVILDELGRGTSTFDGTAIAHAVVLYLKKLGCLTLFSTHYHMLMEEFQSDPQVACYHMACQVNKSDSVTGEDVEFLYQFRPGNSEKSYGTNLAHKAGLPDNVVERAVEMARLFEDKLSNCMKATKAQTASKTHSVSHLTPKQQELIKQIETLMINLDIQPDACDRLRQLKQELQTSINNSSFLY